MSINAKLDKNALQELDTFHKSRTAAECDKFQKVLKDEFQCPESNENEPTIWTYAISMFVILLEIDNELEKYEDLPISVNETKKIHNGIRKCIEYGLKPFLLADTIPIDSRLPNIITTTKVLLRLEKNKLFPLVCTRNDQHLVYTDLLSSIFTILCNASDETKSQFEEHLNGVRSKLSQSEYFKILFLIMGCNKSRSGKFIQPIVHTQLKQSLYKAGSFKALCEALLPSITSLDQDEEIVKKRLHSCLVISSIVAQRGHGNKFHHQIIDEIHQHLLSYIRKDKSHQLYFTDVGVRCLSQLCSLHSTYIQHLLLDKLLGTFNELAKPQDLVAGAIVCDENEIIEAIRLVHLTFCASGPSDDTISSELLTSFIPMFIQIHHIVAESRNKSLKNEILAIIIRCLSNRSQADLNRIIECVLYEEFTDCVKYLHPRLKIEHISSGGNESIRFTIAASGSNDHTIDDELDISKFLQPSISLVNILKQSNHNMLIYNAFLHVLQMFSETFGWMEEMTPSLSSSELLESEAELKKAIEIKFKRKYAVIHALNELILFKQFHGQFVENPHDIISMLDKLIHQQIEQIEAHISDLKVLSSDFSEMLTVILLCAGELILNVKNQELKTQLEHTLKKLRLQLRSERIKRYVSMDTVIRRLDTMLDPGMESSENGEFLKIKAILSESSAEPYTKVYGIMHMIKLIEAKDDDACSNAHIILILAMKMLKEEDSYIFLNCIKLLISLYNILGCTVLETLIAEYHFDIDTDSADIDFKLKVGEALVKVTQGLGEMCFKYKEMLISCFMRGVYSKNDEFRTSNMSNLGSIIQSLSYQVHHFFQEVRSIAL